MSTHADELANPICQRIGGRDQASGTAQLPTWALHVPSSATISKIVGSYFDNSVNGSQFLPFRIIRVQSVIGSQEAGKTDWQAMTAPKFGSSLSRRQFRHRLLGWRYFAARFRPIVQRRTRRSRRLLSHRLGCTRPSTACHWAAPPGHLHAGRCGSCSGAHECSPNGRLPAYRRHVELRLPGT